jgi:hypothetical protein
MGRIDVLATKTNGVNVAALQYSAISATSSESAIRI